MSEQMQRNSSTLDLQELNTPLIRTVVMLPAKDVTVAA